MSNTPLSPLAFLGRMLVLMVPSFLIWAVLAPTLGALAVLVNDWLLPMLWPDAIATVRLNGTEAIFVSAWGELDGKLLPPGQAEEALAVLADTRVVSYSLPFFWALHFALGSGRSVAFWLGTLVLFALMTLGLGAVGLKSLILTIAGMDPSIAAWVLPDINIVAMAYQFSILIVPTVGPVMIWVLQNSDHPLFAGFRPAPKA